MRLMDVNIDSEYSWDGSDGYGQVSSPQTVTAVGIDRECCRVVIRDQEDSYWGVRARTLSPVGGRS